MKENAVKSRSRIRMKNEKRPRKSKQKDKSKRELMKLQEWKECGETFLFVHVEKRSWWKFSFPSPFLFSILSYHHLFSSSSSFLTWPTRHKLNFIHGFVDLFRLIAVSWHFFSYFALFEKHFLKHLFCFSSPLNLNLLFLTSTYSIPI